MHPVLCSFCSINTAFQASLLVFSTGMVARSAQISTKITFSGYGATHCLFHFGHFLKHLLQRLKKWLNLHILWSCSIYRIYYLRPALNRLTPMWRSATSLSDIALWPFLPQSASKHNQEREAGRLTWGRCQQACLAANTCHNLLADHRRHQAMAMQSLCDLEGALLHQDIMHQHLYRWA